MVILLLSLKVAAAAAAGNKPCMPSNPRSCSADAQSRKSVRISCDPSNLHSPSLEVVGTKSPLNKVGSFYQQSNISNEGMNPFLMFFNS